MHDRPTDRRQVLAKPRTRPDLARAKLCRFSLSLSLRQAFRGDKSPAFLPLDKYQQVGQAKRVRPEASPCGQGGWEGWACGQPFRVVHMSRLTPPCPHSAARAVGWGSGGGAKPPVPGLVSVPTSQKSVTVTTNPAPLSWSGLRGSLVERAAARPWWGCASAAPGARRRRMSPLGKTGTTTEQGLEDNSAWS